MMFISFRSLKNTKAQQHQTYQLASECAICCLNHIHAGVFVILFITYHAQDKTNLTHKEQAHTRDAYLGHK